jgi:hypothetical protein
MLGKDGRPLSPLSAAMARAKAGEDPFDEDPADIPSDIRPCPCCGRNFAANRLATHLEICTKVTINSQQRQTWNSQSQRVKDGSMSFGGSSQQPPSPTGLRASRRGVGGGMGSSFSRHGGNEERVPSRSSAASRSTDSGRSSGMGGGIGGGGGGASSSSGGLGGGGGGGEMPANKIPKWKRDRAALRDALRAGRELEDAKARGVPMSELPPPPPTDDSYDDRVPCPHCGRKFNTTAAERHIPKCSSIRAKPKTLLRGSAPGGHGYAPSGGHQRASGGRTPTQYVL